MKEDQTEILQQIKDLELFVATLKANTKAPLSGMAGFLPYFEIAFLMARKYLRLEPRPSVKGTKVETGISIDKVLVISLPFRNDRRESVVQQMAHEGIIFNFFDAIHGKNLALDQISDSLIPRFTKLHLSPGKIGCCLSHALVWKYVLENKLKYLCVLEDDAQLVQNFKQRLEAILLDVPADADIIYIGSCGKTLKRSWISERLFIPYDISCSHGYIVSANGAEKLLTQLFPFHSKTAGEDIQISELIKKKRIKAYHAEPVLVRQGGFSSNILRKDQPMAVQNIHESEI